MIPFDNLMKAMAQNNVYLYKILHVITSKVSRAPLERWLCILWHLRVLKFLT